MGGPPSHPKPIDTVKATDLGNEFLIYDREHDQVHVLNATAREIFLLCDGKRTEREVARIMAERYDLDEQTARDDTRATLEQLYALQVLSR